MMPSRLLPTSAPALMTLPSLKAALGIPLVYADCDQPLTFALNVVSEVVRSETGRWLVRGTYADRFIAPFTLDARTGRVFLTLNEFPVVSISKLTVNGTETEDPTVLLHSVTGIALPEGIAANDEVDVEYIAGYTPLPFDLQAGIADLVRRQLASQGVKLENMGAATPQGAPIRAVNIGSVRVEYAIGVTTANLTSSTQSSVTEAILGEYMTLFQKYKHPRMWAALAS